MSRIKFRRCALFVVSLLISALLCVALMGMTFVAEDGGSDQNPLFGGGEGTSALPYIIENEEDFLLMMDNVNNIIAPDGYFGKFFKLVRDLDLSGKTLNPIGNYTYPFKGNFDGMGFSINGIDIVKEKDSYTGLFGATSAEAVIKNLKVCGNISGFMETGGIVGFNKGLIDNCINEICVVNKDDNEVANLGGICGYNKGVVSNCANLGQIVGHGINTGGIVGINDTIGSITACCNSADVISSFYNVGGIVGDNAGSVESCFNSGKISAYSTVGGVVGSNYGQVHNAYNVALVKADTSMAGGIAGSSEGELKFVYNRANVIATSLKGGICGYVTTASVLEGCFYNKELFAGRMTNRGDNYPDCAAIYDYDMVVPYALEQNGDMKALTNGSGAGNWFKRDFEDSAFMPELKALSENQNQIIAQSSKNSVALERHSVSDIKLATERYVYNGNANEPEIVLNSNQLVRDIDYVVEFENNINAGTAKAKIVLINYYIGNFEKTFEIEKSVLSAEWDANTFVYNGEIQQPHLIITNGKIGNEIITFDYVGADKAVGKHTISATLANTDVNSNYSFLPMSKDYTITQSKLVLKWDETALIYNGKAQYPKATIVGGNFGDDEINLVYFGFENNVNAGENYCVSVRVDGNLNYDLNETYTYEILKKEISVVFETTEFVYNGSFQYPKIASVSGVVDDEQILFVYSDYENNINATNDYSVFAELADNDINKNYLFEKQQYVYEIKAKQLTLSFLDEKLVYNGQAQRPEFEIVGLVGDEKVEYILSDYSQNINACVEDSYSITINLNTGDNYSFEVVTFDYVISPAEILVKWTDTKLIYNGQFQHPQAEIVTEISDEVGLLYSNYDGKDAGSGHEITILSDNSNFVVANKLTYDILPKTLSTSWSADSFEYDGLVHYPTAQFDGIINSDIVDVVYEKQESIIVAQYLIKLSSNNKNYDFDNANFSYDILPKQIFLINVSAENKKYDGNVSVNLTGGELRGFVKNDVLGFAFQDVVAESPNVGEREVSFKIALSGDRANCYKVSLPKVNVKISKAVFDLESVKFNSKTLSYNGKNQSIFVEGEVPECLKIEYSGNEMTSVGEYVVVAHFVDKFGNFESIEDLTAIMFISDRELVDSDNMLNVSLVDGVLPYKTYLQVEKIAEWQQEHKGQNVLGVYKIQLLKDGKQISLNNKIKISIFLDKKTLKSKKLTVLQSMNNENIVIDYEIQDNNLVFYVNDLSDIILLSEKVDWVLIGSLPGSLLLIIICLAILIFVINKKRKSQYVVKESVAVLEQPVAEPVKVESITERIIDKAFVIDGIECASKTSFLAALCYKDKDKQKQIASMQAEKALSYAQGKGGLKRKDLYWQGKNIQKDSKEYKLLLKRVSDLQNNGL